MVIISPVTSSSRMMTRRSPTHALQKTLWHRRKWRQNKKYSGKYPEILAIVWDFAEKYETFDSPEILI